MEETLLASTELAAECVIQHPTMLPSVLGMIWPQVSTVLKLRNSGVLLTSKKKNTEDPRKVGGYIKIQYWEVYYEIVITKLKIKDKGIRHREQKEGSQKMKRYAQRN